jgi:hypothetical protein
MAKEECDMRNGKENTERLEANELTERELAEIAGGGKGGRGGAGNRTSNPLFNRPNLGPPRPIGFMRSPGIAVPTGLRYV